MNAELAFEYRVLGGSVSDALMSIKHIEQLDQLESLLKHERAHMNRKSVFRAIEGRLRKLKKRLEA